MIPKKDRAAAPNQPGTYGEEIAAINRYLDLPAVYRRRWPRSAWQAVRASIVAHARRPRREDLESLAKQGARR